MTHHTHCALRLGDNMAALQLIRRLAKDNPDREFVHACPFGYMRLKENLAPMVEDLPNVRLVDISEAKRDSVDLWKGVDGWFYKHPQWQDYVRVMLDFYALACVRIGLPCPIQNKADLLFDYPALMNSAACGTPEVDWLVINSMPLSGQFPGYNLREMDELVWELSRKHVVATTQRTDNGNEHFCAQRSSVTEIGRLSMGAKHILMVSTGPSWATFNPWTEQNLQLRVILLANERVEIGRNTIHRGTIAGARELLKEHGFI